MLLLVAERLCRELEHCAIHMLAASRSAAMLINKARASALGKAFLASGLCSAIHKSSWIEGISSF
jgi:hypothetical protein